jgi:hypothetical protein
MISLGMRIRLTIKATGDSFYPSKIVDSLDTKLEIADHFSPGNEQKDDGTRPHCQDSWRPS